jgi:WD40 repeat protein
MVMCPDGKAVAMSYQNSGATAGVAAASWDSTTGFGSFFSLPTTVYGVARGIAFNPAGTALLCTGTTTPYVYAYRFSSTTGFLTKYANPTALVSQSYGVAFSPDGAYCAVGLSTTNWFTWSWTDAGGFGTRTTRSGGSVKYDIEWTPAGDAVVAVGQSTGAVVAWPWSAGTLGTQSSVTMAGISIGCAISPSGKAIFRTISSGLSDPTLSIEAYPYNTATGIGTRYSYPSVLPAGYLRQIICI